MARWQWSGTQTALKRDEAPPPDNSGGKSIQHGGTQTGAPLKTPFFNLRLFQSLTATWLEVLWPLSWPALSIPALFLCLSLAGLTPSHPWAHTAWLAGFILCLASALGYLAIGLKRNGVPGWGHARRRLDDETGLAHQPISSFADRPAAPAKQKTVADALWRRHLIRLSATLGAVPAVYPRLSHRRSVRIGGWFLAATLVILAVMIWRGPSDLLVSRLAQAAIPDFSRLPATPRPTLDVWIAPPAYTNKPPVVLASAVRKTPSQPPEAVETPVGSRILIRTFGAVVTPTARLGGRNISLTQTGDTHEASLPYAGEGALSIQLGEESLAAWPLTPLPDTPPEISMPKPPRQGQRLALRIDYQAVDDYAVEQAWAEIIPAEGDGRGTATPLLIALARNPEQEISGTVYRDLTPHPWAGRSVEIRLKADDAIGQTAVSEPALLTLPEREFTHPLARDIIIQRKRLNHAAAAPSVAEELGRLAAALRQSGGDRTVFLGLDRSRSWLSEPPRINDTLRLLWDLALRLEDGALGKAEHELRAAQEALENALANDAEADEINRLTEQLRKALREFLREWQNRQIAQQPDNFTDQSEPTIREVTPESLENLLDQAQDMMRLGSRDAAQQLLSELRDTLENLQRPNQNSEGDSREAVKTLQSLRDMAQNQQELLDRSFERRRQRSLNQTPSDEWWREYEPAAPGQDQSSAADNQRQQDADRQSALRRRLGDLMLDLGERLGDIPPDLGKAERAMRDAVEALRRPPPADAVKPQSRALGALQDAERSVADQLAKTLAQSGSNRLPSSGNSRLDPFGQQRDNQGTIDSGHVKIPSEAAVGRAYEILRELRRRAGDSNRSETDRAYIDRLLPKF